MRPVNATEALIPRRPFDAGPPSGDVLGVCSLGPTKAPRPGPVASMRERARKRASMSRFDDHPPEETMPKETPQTITVKELAALTGLAPRDVRERIEAARVRKVHQGRGRHNPSLYDRAAALAWVEQRKAKAAPKTTPSEKPPLSSRRQASLDRLEKPIGTIPELIEKLRKEVEHAESECAVRQAALAEADARLAGWRNALQAVEALA